MGALLIGLATCVPGCFSHVQLFATPWTVARQAPLLTGFSRPEYRSGLPFPSPGYLPQLGHMVAVKQFRRQGWKFRKALTAQQLESWGCRRTSRKQLAGCTDAARSGRSALGAFPVTRAGGLRTTQPGAQKEASSRPRSSCGHGHSTSLTLQPIQEASLACYWASVDVQSLKEQHPYHGKGEN